MFLLNIETVIHTNVKNQHKMTHTHTQIQLQLEKQNSFDLGSNDIGIDTHAELIFSLQKTNMQSQKKSSINSKPHTFYGLKHSNWIEVEKKNSAFVLHEKNMIS